MLEIRCTNAGFSWPFFPHLACTDKYPEVYEKTLKKLIYTSRMLFIINSLNSILKICTLAKFAILGIGNVATVLICQKMKKLQKSKYTQR